MGDLLSSMTSPWLENLTKVERVSATLNNGETLTMSGSDADTNRLIVTEIVHGDDCDVTIEADSNSDGSYDRSITVDSFTGAGISQANQIKLDGVEMQIVVKNTGSPADFIIMGEGAA